MLFLWLWILLFVVFFWKQKQDQDEKQICTQPVMSLPPITGQQQQQQTEPPSPENEQDATTTMIGIQMNGSTIMMRVGETRKVALSGNATTGYAWRIVKIDGDSVHPNEKWQYQLRHPVLTGSGGYFQREFKAVQPGITDVYFIYDPVSNPIRFGYYYFLRFDVRG